MQVCQAAAGLSGRLGSAAAAERAANTQQQRCQERRTPPGRRLRVFMDSLVFFSTTTVLLLPPTTCLFFWHRHLHPLAGSDAAWQRLLPALPHGVSHPPPDTHPPILRPCSAHYLIGARRPTSIQSETSRCPKSVKVKSPPRSLLPVGRRVLCLRCSVCMPRRSRTTRELSFGSYPQTSRSFVFSVSDLETRTTRLALALPLNAALQCSKCAQQKRVMPSCWS